MKKGCHPTYKTPRYWKKPGCKWGEKNPNRKLTWEIVGQIRSVKAGYGVTKMLADKFGIAKSNIRAIRRGTYWAMSSWNERQARAA